jgi:hypothetical protein
MPANPICVGIDVAQTALEVALQPSAAWRVVLTAEAGIAPLVARSAARQPVLMGREATGNLEVLGTRALAAAGLPVVVVHPRQARDLATATGQLATAAALETRALAHVAEAVRPALRHRPEAQTRARRVRLTRRRQLVERLMPRRTAGRGPQGPSGRTFKPISPGWTRVWPTSIPISAGPSARVRSGGSMTPSGTVRRGEGPTSPTRGWLSCRSWVC